VENEPRYGRGRRILTVVLRLDPAAPLLWRTATSAQLGEPAVAVVDPVPPAVEAVLRALSDGIEPEPLARLAGGAGVDAHALAVLLERLRPALLPASAPARLPLRVLIDAPAELVAALGPALARIGHAVEPAAGDPDAARGAGTVVILAAHHVLPPARYVRWLAADVPHLAVVVGDRGAAIGPFVVPGTTPCLRCRDEHRLAVEPCWPAVAAQLLARRSSLGSADRHLMAELVATVARALSALEGRRPTGLEGGSLWIDAATGSVSRRASPWHERCSCCWPDRGRDRPGTERADAPPTAHGTPWQPRTAAAARAPA
jgi:hypothetical protein